jgi:hypothetical protein
MGKAKNYGFPDICRPGAWRDYGWGTETFMDFARIWVAGAMSMFLYGILRMATLSN